MSGFSGHLQGFYSSLSLDRFDDDNQSSTVYWLSHAHSDHMVGLGSNQLFARLKSNTKIRIYCTEVTRKLVSCMSKFSHLDDHMTCLHVDEPTVVEFPSIDSSKTSLVTLTAISAGHCPGSAMLLIEGGEGTALYTGDFRFDMGMVMHITSLHDSGGNVKPIDVIYCDTTFFTLRALNIPSRSDCEEEVIRQVNEHISKGDNYHILLKIKAKLGYENVFRILYDNLGIKTHIEPRDAYLYSKLPDILETVTPDSSSQVHACCRFIVTSEEAAIPRNIKRSEPVTKCKALTNPKTHIKTIQLSTMWFVHKEEKEMWKQTTKNTVRCCYSFHSSYSEIEDFIRYLKPKAVHASVPAMRSTKERTEAHIQELLNNDSQGSHTLEDGADAWQSVKQVDAWWLNKKAIKDVGPPSSKKSKLSHTSPIKHNTSFCSGSTKSRESTPELDLWSDEDDDQEDTTNGADKTSEKPSAANVDNANESAQKIGNDDVTDFDSDNEVDAVANSFFHSADARA